MNIKTNGLALKIKESGEHTESEWSQIWPKLELAISEPMPNNADILDDGVKIDALWLGFFMIVLVLFTQLNDW